MILTDFINKIRRKLIVLSGRSSKYISKIGDNKPWVFISYIPEAIHFSFDDTYLNAHQSHREMLEIVKVYNEMGYNVYCSNFMNKHIPKMKFDIIFGIEPAFVSACEYNPKALKIYYATGAYSGHQNTMIRKRTDEFNRKWQINYPYQRLVHEKDFLSNVDKILQIGSIYTIDTYPVHVRKKITTIHQSSSMLRNIDTLNKDYSNRHDILWIGGGGEILKGLDLCIDALGGNANYDLHIVGNVGDDFKRIYSKYKNIHYYGFLNINSSEFLHICEKCNFLIYPSCTEGMPGSVINSMYLGVIPIVSRWAAFDEIQKYGYLLKDLTVSAIHESLEWIKKLEKSDIKNMSEQCVTYSRETYNLERFAREFKEYMQKEKNH